MFMGRRKHKKFASDEETILLVKFLLYWDNNPDILSVFSPYLVRANTIIGLRAAKIWTGSFESFYYGYIHCIWIFINLFDAKSFVLIQFQFQFDLYLKRV